MSSSVDTEDVVSASDDGVTVTKRYAPEEFPVPAIRFEIDSDHSGPVTVRLTESIPESFPMDAVGFHPEYHSDQWTAFQDNRVQFTGTVEPDSSLVTVYGIRLDDEFDSSAFLTEPSITVEGSDTSSESTASDVSESVEDVVSTDGNEVVKDMLSGDRDSVPGLDSSESPSETEADDSTDDAEPEIELDIDAAAERVAGDEPSEADRSTEPEAGDVDESADNTGSTETESSSERKDGNRSAADEGQSIDARHETDLVSDLATALRSESRDDADLRAIREALDTSSSGPTQAKLSHLQERVEEVAAYTGALEEFLDETGTGAAVIADVQDELEALRSELTGVREAVEANSTAVAELDSTVADHSERLDSVSTTATSVETDLSAVDDSVSDIESTLSDHDDSLEAVSDRVSSLDSAVDEVDDRTSEVASDVEDNAAALESLSGTVDTIEADLESVSADVVDIIEWRDQLGSMFTDD